MIGSLKMFLIKFLNAITVNNLIKLAHIHMVYLTVNICRQ